VGEVRSAIHEKPIWYVSWVQSPVIVAYILDTIFRFAICP
jgi:hypothetical protein